jgi:hypothetical protein
MRRLLPVLACGFAYLAFAFPSGALANDPGLACKLLGPDLGKLPPFGSTKHPAHVLEHGSHGTDEQQGSYTSNCEAIVFHKKPDKNTFGPPPRYRVPPGFSQVTLSVTTEDDEELSTGAPWNPNEVQKEYLVGIDSALEVYGGDTIAMPEYGQDAVHAFWVGHKNNFAEALWRHEQDEGFIDMSLQTHGGAPDLLDLLAAGIVPRFNP